MFSKPRSLKVGIPFIVVLVILVAVQTAAAATITVDADLTTLSPTDLVNILLGSSEATVSNVIYTGAPIAAGTFGGGTDTIGFDSGILLSSGNVADAPGPNVSDSTTTLLGLPGDADLNALVPGYTTNDATILEFDFDCQGIPIFSFEYVFASDEYNEWVYSSFNDVFGFFLDGANIALLPDGETTVAINNVNNYENSLYYRDNDPSDLGTPPIDIEADGLTVVLPAVSDLEPGTHHIKLAIADAGDQAWDSWVFLRAGSFQCAPPSGFVTGGGWYNSAAGAYRPDPELAGSANFGFVSRYKKGATIPTGQTQFMFQVADLNFHSSSYDWLIVTRGGTMAQFKGEGTINGEGTYKFTIWAGDDDPDTFRIRIWEENGGMETVIYDNEAHQPIDGGQIVIHSS